MKYSDIEVRAMLLEEGCELLEPYSGCSVPLVYKCSCGNKGKTKITVFRRGVRCDSCRRRKQATSRTLDPAIVDKSFADAGCKLLEQYTSSSTPMRFKCSCGETSTITWSNFRCGGRCFKCGVQKHSGPNHPRYEHDRDAMRLRQKITQKYRNMLRNALSQSDRAKDDKACKLLGYSPTDLQRHLESFPEWNDLKKTSWHLDHILPISAFLKAGIQDLQLINCLDNLRPVSSGDNLKKNDSFDPHQFENWLMEKGWFREGASYVKKMCVQPLGFEVSFLIPSSKISITRDRIHSFALHHCGGYTIETISAHGAWRSNEVTTEESIAKYVMSFAGRDRVGLFIDFLSEICGSIGEQCLYLTMGRKSFLVKPHE